MIKSVIFDLDGTLLDRDKSVIFFLERQYERLHPWLKSIPKESYIARFIELEDHGYVWKAKVYTQMVDEFGIQGCTSELLLQDYLDHFQASCIAFPGMVSTLQSLREKGFKLGMITNGLEIMQTRSIRGLGIEPFFEEILISEKEGCAKPNPIIFQRALERLNVKTEEAVYVGDHPVNDIEAAQLVGMKAVWKKHSFSQNVKADAEIDELEELFGILERF
ncbi:HAD family hydrolase [Jeotgalibacillus soli]|uniref:L-2-haloalkanoic acid dehalogenase n=1 Tax=Jeotgalibacillus soli TaxID=889306 RepID=A0A0C2VKK0_9BACL|nr:HAD-IA family hydrolase [Jeotgalibacillus soli]KIL49432.1 L-2-haloalkanoic acid dehalogenase [Jeotgalibacillus soli]